MAVLTSLRISLILKGLPMKLVDMLLPKFLLMLHIYAAGLLIPCIVQCIYLALFLNRVMNLLNSDVNLVNLHKVI